MELVRLLTLPCSFPFFYRFVHSLSVFHPSASSEEKQAFAFQLYDLDGTGSIERREVKDMLLALMRDNPNLSLPESALERIIDKTFEEVDLCGDGKIHFNEWKQLVLRNPNVINNMTLDVLRDVTARYSGFILSSTATPSTPWLSQLQAFSYMPIAR
jgi:serine/threonine-protein phosphatase 2B regulatory subunit